MIYWFLIWLFVVLTLPSADLSAQVASAQARTLRPGDLYEEGDRVEFKIERRGEVIGRQRATCVGSRLVEGDSLLYFEMETKSVFERSGKMLDMNVKCEIGYQPNGAARRYDYELSLLNASVTHHGVLTGTEYVGETTRLGIRQPFNIPLQRWPVIFDNNFALQWEIALYPIRRNPGDTLHAETLIPQLDRLVAVTIVVQPNETIVYGGQTVTTRVLKLDQLNQTIYLDERGVLLKAVDKQSGISVTRLAAGETAELPTQPFLDTFMSRIPGYGMLAALAAVWAAGFGWRRVNSSWPWVILVVGASLYVLSLQILPWVQERYFSFVLDPRSPSTSIYIPLLGSALIFALVELLAIVSPLVVLNGAKRLTATRAAIAIGAFSGIGFGLIQACNLTGFGPDGSLLIRADLLQKFALIGLNAVCGAWLAQLIVRRQPAVFYLFPIGFKMLFNWTAAFLQKGALTVAQHAVLGLVVTLLALVAYFLIYRREPLPAQLKPARKS